jgi:hypothetical protein
MIGSLNSINSYYHIVIITFNFEFLHSLHFHINHILKVYHLHGSLTVTFPCIGVFF